MWFQLTYDKSLKHSHIGVQEKVVVNIILEIVLSLFVIIKCEYAQSKKKKKKKNTEEYEKENKDYL